MDRYFLIVGRDTAAGIHWYDEPRKVDALNIGHVWLTGKGRAKVVVDHPFYNVWFREVTDEYRARFPEYDEAADIEATQEDASYRSQ